MNVVGVRELSRRTSALVDRVRRTGKPIVVTKHGAPAVALVQIDRYAPEDVILSTVPEFTRGLKRADAELRRGKTRELSEVLAEIRSPKPRPRSRR